MPVVTRFPLCPTVRLGVSRAGLVDPRMLLLLPAYRLALVVVRALALVDLLALCALAHCFPSRVSDSHDRPATYWHCYSRIQLPRCHRLSGTHRPTHAKFRFCQSRFSICQWATMLVDSCRACKAVVASNTS